MAAKRIEHLNTALEWLEASINPQTGGSRAWYSRVYRPLTGWSAEYPETTGYIIPTFFDAAAQHPPWARLRAKAFRMADWLIGLQAPDGGLPGGFYRAKGGMPPSIFNTAQIIKGLARAWQESGESRYLEAAAAASRWLCGTQEPDGTWKRHAYRGDFFPSYYSLVAWPMLIGYQLTRDERIARCAERTLEHIQRRTNARHYVEDCGFEPGGWAFLHTVVYTIRGFLESALILNRDDFWETGKAFAEQLLLKFEIRHRLAGAYYPDFREVAWYQCLTGNCQMAVAWMKIHAREGDARYLSAASKAIDLTAERQSLRSPDPGVRGGIAGSSPFWGRYMAFRYPNWAAKFFSDAVMLEARLLEEAAAPQQARSHA